jgi:hypothetical protein
MSMILDAIKRSKESETLTDGVPSVDTEHYIPSESTSRLPWVIAAASVGLLLAVLLWQALAPDETAKPPMIVDQQSAPDEVRNETSTAPSSTPAAAEPASEPGGNAPSIASAVSTAAPKLAAATTDVPPSADVRLPDKPAESVVADFPARTATTSGDDERLSALYAAMNQEESPTPEPEFASLEGVSEAETGPEEPRIEFVEILERAQREMGSTPLVESSVPMLDSLSQQTKDQIPSLIYNDHYYQELGESSVLMNGQTVRENQRVGPFVLVEILPDSAILRWRDVEFRLRARNSWINL